MLIAMMSCVQVIVSLINATGLGVKISEFIVNLAGGLLLMGARLSTDIIEVALVALAIGSHLFMPEMPLIGTRPATAKLIDLSEIQWDEKDTERLLTRVDAEAEL